MYKAKSRYRNEIASTYFEQRVLEPQWQVEQRSIEALIVKYAKKNDSILDAPLGTGRFLPLYIEMGLTIYGLDISEDMLEEARRLTQGQDVSPHLIIGDVEKIPLADDSVDHVVCIRFMNWIPIDVISRVLTEFVRVSQGAIIVQIRVSTMRGAFGRLGKSIASGKDLAKYVFADTKKSVDFILRLMKAQFYRIRYGDVTGAGAISQTHKRSKIMEIISSIKLKVVEELTLDESFYNPRWVSRPLNVFVLKRGDIESAKSVDHRFQ